jgi:hypothetical protein
MKFLRSFYLPLVIILSVAVLPACKSKSQLLNKPHRLQKPSPNPHHNQHQQHLLKNQHLRLLLKNQIIILVTFNLSLTRAY